MVQVAIPEENLVESGRMGSGQSWESSAGNPQLSLQKLPLGAESFINN